MNFLTEIKNYDDICKIDGVDPIKSLPYPEATTADEIAVNSAAKVFRINRVLNEGWQPDWTNWDERKYYPWFDYTPGSGSGFAYCDYLYDRDHSSVGARLVYKSSELAKFAGETFLQEYRGFMVIEK